jgi:hypothetical protein
MNADLVDEDVERAVERYNAADMATSAAPETLATRALAGAHLDQ